MDEKLKERIKSAIHLNGSIRCVSISKDDKFFIFWKPDIYHPETVDYDRDGVSGVAPERMEYAEEYSIFYKDRVLHGKEAEKFWQKNDNENEDSPVFSIQDIIELEQRKDKEVTIHSKKYLTPIKDLFREIELIQEKRTGGKGRYQRLVQRRNNFLIKTAQQLMKKMGVKYYPIKELQDELEEFMLKQKYSEDTAEAKRQEEKFDISDATIRGILDKSKIKK